MTLTFTIPPELWLTANRTTTNRGHRAAIVAKLQHLGATTAQAAHLSPVTPPVALDWTIRYPKGVRTDKGDPVNAAPTTKALLDALVTVKWIPDDGPLHVTSETFRRGPNLDVGRLHVVELTTNQEDR